MITISGLAWKNLRRNLFRSIAITVGVAAATGTIFTVSTVMQSVRASLNRSAARLGSDLIVVPETQKRAAREAMAAGIPLTYYMPASVLPALDEVQLYHTKLKKKLRVVNSAASQLYYLTPGDGSCDVGDKLLIGFDPENDFSILPWLKDYQRGSLAADEVLVGHNIPHQKNFKIQLFNRIFNVAGKLESSGNPLLDDAIFMPQIFMKNLLRTSNAPLPAGISWDNDIISAVLVRTTPLFPTRRSANQISHDVKGAEAIVAKQVQTSVGKQLFLLLKAVFLAGGVLWGISFLLIAVIFSMVVNERIREMGLLRAMGASRKTIFRLTIIEAALLSTVGGSLGGAAGGLLLFGLKNYIESSFSIPFQWPDATQFALLAAVCLALGILTGVSAALVPAVRCSAMEPGRALLKGDQG